MISSLMNIQHTLNSQMMESAVEGPRFLANQSSENDEEDEEDGGSYDEEEEDE